MGNSHTKEARDPNAPLSPHDPRAQGAGNQHASGSSSQRARARSSRSDLGGIFGISGGGSSSSTQPPYERRETKQEREARRLERERQTRIIERERSLKEEHVDGGYLVTLGTYVGTEDFNKSVVRQLQIERRLAPFWRGLEDFSETWTEYQIVAAARGLPLPAADAIPPDELIPRPVSAASPAASSQNIDSLMVPMGGRTQSTASERSGMGLGSHLPSPTSGSGTKSIPFKRPKGLAAALNLSSSRNNSTTDIAAPREIKMAHDPFVNGQPMEVFLYKDGSECPICFLYYPPYLNHTRCCDQPICSECFVQIKRADPHYPEGHGVAEGSERPPEEQAGLLISEPASCPYCQQQELGVTYEAPPFRRGLTYSSSWLSVGAMGTAMSSSSSLNSNLSPTSVSHPTSAGSHSRRRTQSLSANAPNVITTDRVRPDWATKLAAQRAHIARRAAAATALHTAAFLMGNNEQQRSIRIGRFSRRNTAERVPGVPPGTAPTGGSPARAEAAAGENGSGSPGGGEARSSSARGIVGVRRSRMEDLEEMMFAEAIRLSLAAEEERKRKAEKEELKESKRKEKEDKKAAKAAAKGSGSGPYAGSSASSLAGSALSLPSLGLGRRRENSTTSNLRMEASVASAIAATGSGSSNPPTADAAAAVPAGDKGKGVDRPASTHAAESHEEADLDSALSPISATGSQPISTSLQQPARSHLRQMSNASSIIDLPHADAPGSVDDIQSSGGASLGGEGQTVGNSTEPVFNLESLAPLTDATVHSNDKAAVSSIKVNTKFDDSGEVQHLEDATGNMAPSTQAGQASSPPDLLVTPGTPALENDGFETNKKLEFRTSAQYTDQRQHSL